MEALGRDTGEGGMQSRDDKALQEVNREPEEGLDSQKWELAPMTLKV